MKIIDEPLLQTFRDKLRCEICLRAGSVETHHLYTKGTGGSRRFDIAINLIALCIDCHTQFHNGRLSLNDLLNLVAEREGVLPGWITEEIWRLRREGKAVHALPPIVDGKAVGLPPVFSVAQKRCNKCGHNKPLADFLPHRGGCRACVNEYQRLYAQRRKQCKK